MNMSITSSPLSSTKAVSGSSGNASGSAAGSGFAGALVQAIDGSSNSNATKGSTLPAGLAGLLGQLNLESSSNTSEDLLTMLAKLVDQLQQLEQSEKLPQEAEDQLASLFASLQGLMQQQGQSQSSNVLVQEIAVTTQAPSEQPITQGSKPVVQVLREALQQLSSVIASGKDSLQLPSSFAEELKNVLDKLLPQAANATPINEAGADKLTTATTATKSSTASDSGTAVPKDALNQTAAVVQEPRRPIPALREPLWRVNVAGVNEVKGQESQPAIVTNVAAVETVANSESQPAWTFMQGDSLANTDVAADKATVPAQVPVQQFAQQMEKFLVKQFQLSQGNGVSEAKLTLTPEHLGQVDIRIVLHNGQLTAQFITDNAMARDMIENQMAQLKTALNGQGLQVERLEVVQQPASTGTAFMQQDNRNSNSGNGKGSNGQEKGDSYEDPALFAAELERTSFLKEFGYGSSLNVTA
ncbi:flagellar hook-length control protein FliK [Cohnella abietis]|uniref:Flagellar hook-length control protein-like C-terminal domain-containing protein n=1 Tax=Cohnella abietis TaxID=2507935 RepID=A0A3T1D8M8_9BACL|nr:flagellar hook-length control protein FliK [Cohnella abietis]BBI34436.1 hypothetical protein KCTCHS21_38350 [Cohnella abietis]